MHGRAPRRAPRRDRSGILLAAVLAAVLFACEQPFTRTNPYDPSVAGDITVVGPDTLFSASEYAQFHIQSTPAFSDTSGYWDSSNYQDLRSTGGGRYQVFGAPLFPLFDSVQVTVGLGAYDTVETIDDSVRGPTIKAITMYRRQAEKTVLVTQRLVQIQLRCPDTHACTPVAAGASWTVWVDGFDALGGQIFGMASDSPNNPATGPPIATFTVRDPAVASVTPVGIRVGTVTALATGSTWLIATRGTLLDSLQLVVH